MSGPVRIQEQNRTEWITGRAAAATDARESGVGVQRILPVPDGRDVGALARSAQRTSPFAPIVGPRVPGSSLTSTDVRHQEMSTPIKACLYFALLYAWWSICANFFHVEVPVPQPRASFVDPPTVNDAETQSASSSAASIVIDAAAAPVEVAKQPGGVERPSHIVKCPPNRRPFHTLLTAQGSVYNQWQARIMYHHWKKQRAADGPCTEMCAQQPCQP